MKPAFALSLSALLRFVIPGFILAITTYPLIISILHEIHVGASVDYLLPMLTVFSGWLVVICDMPIYMLLEGRRYWPRFMWSFFLVRQQKRIDRLEDEEDKAFKKRDSRWCEHRYREASVELRQYPLAEGKPRAEWPTRLGNILHAYEGYSYRIYGLDAAFFWPRMWFILDDKIRSEIDSRQALVDSAVYLSFCFGLSSILLFGYAVGRLLDLRLCPVLDWSAWMLLAAISAVTSYIIYRLSLYAHMQFGEMWKAVFDIYHDKLDIRIDDELGEWAYNTKSLNTQSNRTKRDYMEVSA